MKNGYVYALVNSSMPGLVKVGMTQRDPSGRAQELSGVTGVPTPFIVAYEEYVTDCVAVESFVHELLEKKGFRVSKNREFFSAPVKDVISAILAIPEIYRQPENTESPAFLEDGSDSIKVSTYREPWRPIWDTAEEMLYGYGEELQDEKEAYLLYQSAAKLGCNLAYGRLGIMHLVGYEGIEKSSEKAMSFFKAGAKCGNYVCYLQMATLYKNEGNFLNAEKCLIMFLKSRAQSRCNDVEDEMQADSNLFFSIVNNIDFFKELSEEYLDMIFSEKDALLEVAHWKWKSYKKKKHRESEEAKAIGAASSWICALGLE